MSREDAEDTAFVLDFSTIRVIDPVTLEHTNTHDSHDSHDSEPHNKPSQRTKQRPKPPPQPPKQHHQQSTNATHFDSNTPVINTSPRAMQSPKHAARMKTTKPTTKTGHESHSEPEADFAAEKETKSDAQANQSVAKPPVFGQRPSSFSRRASSPSVNAGLSRSCLSSPLQSPNTSLYSGSRPSSSGSNGRSLLLQEYVSNSEEMIQSMKSSRLPVQHNFRLSLVKKKSFCDSMQRWQEQHGLARSQSEDDGLISSGRTDSTSPDFD